MNPIRNILVIVDPTAERQPAVDKAARLAQVFGARLHLFICDTRGAREARMAIHARERPHEPFAGDALAKLEKIAEPLRAHGLEVTTEIECAAPLHTALIERTQRTTAELVVKDTHHHSLARRTFLTNTDWELIRRCPVALLLTKEKPWPASPRVCAAVDPTHVNDKPALLDKHILDCASITAQRLGGELHVLHVYLPLAIAAAATGGVPPMATTVSAQELAEEEASRRKQVEELVKDYGVSSDRVHLEVGGPGDMLPRAAERLEMDVMTMGAISRSGLKRAFIGSTAEDVLEHLPCDALVIKPPNFAAMLPI